MLNEARVTEISYGNYANKDQKLFGAWIRKAYFCTPF